MVVAAARHDAALQRRRTRLRSAVARLLPGALTAAEASDLTLRLYDAAPGMYGGTAGLTPWERAWYEHDLPAAPAHILVGAAGSGRECTALIDLGYTVDAFEPIATMAEVCRKAVLTGDVVRCDYNEFSAAVLDGEGGAAAVFADRAYDAVILGWGSLTHVVSDADRRRLFAAAARLAPRGPILMSFFLQPDTAIERPLSRAERAGLRFGVRLGRWRRIAPLGEPCGLHWHLGLTHVFTSEEIAAYTAAIGREATCSSDDYGHATLRIPE